MDCGRAAVVRGTGVVGVAGAAGVCASKDGFKTSILWERPWIKAVGSFGGGVTFGG